MLNSFLEPYLRLMKLACLLLLVVVASSCSLGSEPDPQIITDFLIVSGDEQTGRVNTVLARPLVVQVNDLEGDPIQNVRVSWAIEIGSGAISSELTRTDRAGQTAINWQLGNEPGVGGVTARIAEPGAQDFAITFGATVLP